MPPMNKLTVNTLLNLSGGVGSILVYIVTTPLLLNILGLQGFGAFSIIWILLNIAGALDFGIGRAVSYELAHGDDAQESVGGMIAIAVGFVFLLGIGLGALFVLTSNLFSAAFLSGFDTQGPATAGLMVLVGIAIPFSSASTVLMLVLEGQRRFVSANLYQVLATILIQAGPVVLFYLHVVDDAHAVIAAAILLRIAAFLLLALFVVFDPKTRSGARPNRTLLKALLVFGGKVQLSSLSEPVLENVDKFILSSLVGPAAVAVYNIPFQIHNKMKLLPISLTRSVIPEVAAARGHAHQLVVAEQAFTMLVRTSTPLLVLLLALYSTLMQLWLGDAEGAKVTDLGLVLMLGVWFNFIAHVPFGALQGAGRPGAIAVVQVAQIGPYIGLMFVLIHLFGAQGAALAWTTRAIVDSVILVRMSGIRRDTLALAMPHLAAVIFTWLLAFTIHATGPIAYSRWVPGLFALAYLVFSARALTTRIRPTTPKTEYPASERCGGGDAKSHNTSLKISKR